MCNSTIALRGRSKNRTGYLEATQLMVRTNKVIWAVCSKAIVKRECLEFALFSRLDDYNQTLLLGESNSDCKLFPVCLSDLVTSRPRSAIGFGLSHTIRYYIRF